MSATVRKIHPNEFELGSFDAMSKEVGDACVDGLMAMPDADKTFDLEKLSDLRILFNNQDKMIGECIDLRCRHQGKLHGNSPFLLLTARHAGVRALPPSIWGDQWLCFGLWCTAKERAGLRHARTWGRQVSRRRRQATR